MIQFIKDKLTSLQEAKITTLPKINHNFPVTTKHSMQPQNKVALQQLEDFKEIVGNRNNKPQLT